MRKLIAAMAVVPMLLATSVLAEEVSPTADLTEPAKRYLEMLVNEKLKTMSLVRIESGKIAIHHDSNPTLRHTGACPSVRGDVGRYVKFETPFIEKPKVVMSLTFLDHVIDQGLINNLRITAEVVETFPDGFSYNVNTWCNTDIWAARVSWIAYGR